MGEITDPLENEREPQIDWERQNMAREYARRTRMLLIAESVLGAAYVLALLLSSGAVRLRATLEVLGTNFAIVAAYFVLAYAVYSILMLPLAYFGGYRTARRYGLSTQSTGGWMIDWLKGSVITLVFGLVVVEVLYWVIPAYPSWWWLIMAGVAIAFTVVLANLAPIILVPLFYRLRPIENSELADRLVDMSARAGAKVRGVYRMDLSSKTTAANAALMGIGNTRRVVLGDTLLDRYSAGEIETVYAHEFGHHVHSDIPVLILVQSIGTLVGLYLVSIILERVVHPFGIASTADVASLPLLALTFGLLGVLWMPVTNGISRWMENRADIYAVQSTGMGRAYRDALIRLCNQNLAVLYPSKLEEWFFYSHPPIGSRITLVESLAKQQP